MSVESFGGPAAAVCTPPIPGLDDHPVRTLAFAAPAPAPARTGPLTWAQQLPMERAMPGGESAGRTFSLPLRLGVHESDVLAAVRKLVETFEALRTVYPPPPDGPGQRVLPAGELTIPVVAADKGAGAATAARVAGDMGAEPFDIAGEWPIRVALVTAGGRPRYLAIAASHLAVDQAGGTWLRYHLRGVLAEPPAEVRLPARTHHPLDEAEWERSDVGRRHAERALARHERVFRAMPQTMLPRAADPAVTGPRYRHLRFDSAALPAAVAALAHRHDAPPAAVVYAGICAVAGFVSGLDRASLQLAAGNRIGPRTRFAVGAYSQDVPGCVDLAGRSLTDVIVQAGAVVLDAGRFGHHPPAELAARRRAVELDRGVALDLSCRLDYRATCGTPRPASGDSDRTAGSFGLIRSVRQLEARTPADALDRTRWRWTDSAGHGTGHGTGDGAGHGTGHGASALSVVAEDADDMMRLSVLVDTAVLPADETVAWLRTVERLLCAATATEVGASEVGEYGDLTTHPTPAALDAGEWRVTEGGWAHLPAVADLVRRAAGGRRTAVFAAPGPGGHGLLAYLDGTVSGIDIGRLHAACVDALPGVRVAVAPHHYVVCAGAPAGAGDGDGDGPAGTDLAAWQRLPVLARGTGRPD